MTACDARDSESNCQPSVWTFEFSGVCTNNNKGCFYYIKSSNGNYLKVDSSGVYVQEDRVKTLVRKTDDRFYITSDNGIYYLNIKYENASNYYFKSSTSGDDGSKIYFASGDAADEFVTVSFSVDSKASLPAPVSMTVRKGQTVTLPEYEGKLNNHVFTGWKDENGKPVLTPFSPLKDTVLTAVFDETPILWFDPLNGQPAVSYISGSENFPTIYPDRTREGYRLVGWAETPLASEAEYKPNARVELQLENDITLYAVWKKVTKITFVAAERKQVEKIFDQGSFQELNFIEGVAFGDEWMYDDASGPAKYVSSS